MILSTQGRKQRGLLLPLWLWSLCLFLGAQQALAQLSITDTLTQPVVNGQLGLSWLLAADNTSPPLPMMAFTPPVSGYSQLVQPQALSHTLNLSPLSSRFELLRDDYGDEQDGFAYEADRQLQQLPDMQVSLVSDGAHLIPVVRGPVRTSHPHWEYSIEPGAVWRSVEDQGYSRASLPFTLREKNANCSHNGVLSFAYRLQQGVIEASPVAYQIASETCLYLKFNAWGWLKLSMSEAAALSDSPSDALPINSSALIAEFHQQQDRRLPTQPLSQLLSEQPEHPTWPSLSLADFDQRRHLDSQHLSAYGLVIDGVHYRGACATRWGDYPFCDSLLLPSYSLAKSVFASMALMRLERLYPGVRREKIVDHVPACKAAGHWRNVSFEQALDMTTGVYNLLADREDEWSAEMDNHFFFAETHEQKIDYACKGLEKKIPAGQQWIYHSSDTYVFISALQAFLKKNEGERADVFDELFADSHRLGLSPVTAKSMRTYDAQAQSLGGFGLNFYPDDIARLASFINSDAGSADWLDEALYLEAMQRSPERRGLPAAQTGFYYNKGFWGRDYAPLLGCKTEAWVPVMTGYGGISVLLMPNDSVFYMFGDGGEFYAADAVLASHRIKSMCR